MAKNLPKKSNGFFTASEVGVLVEDLRSDFRVFGERMDIFEKKLDGACDTLGRTLERVARIELTQRKFLSNLESHDGRISLLEKTVFK